MGFTYVNSTGTELAPVTSASVTPGWTVAAGDLVALPVWWFNGSAATTGTPSDNSGDGVPWNTLGQGDVSYSSGHLSGAIFWKVMGRGGTVQFTVTNSGSSYTSLAVLEYTPGGTVAGDGWATPLLVQNPAAGTYNGNSLTTTGSSDLVISLVDDANGRTYAAGAGWNLRVSLTSTADEPGAVEDQLNVAAGTVTPSWSLGASAGTGTFAIFSAALKVTAAAPSTHLLSLLGCGR